MLPLLDRSGRCILFLLFRLGVVLGRCVVGTRPEVVPSPDLLLLALCGFGDLRSALPAAGDLGDGQGVGIECSGVKCAPCLGEGGGGSRCAPRLAR